MKAKILKTGAVVLFAVVCLTIVIQNNHKAPKTKENATKLTKNSPVKLDAARPKTAPRPIPELKTTPAEKADVSKTQPRISANAKETTPDFFLKDDVLKTQLAETSITPVETAQETSITPAETTQAAPANEEASESTVASNKDEGDVLVSDKAAIDVNLPEYSASTSTTTATMPLKPRGQLFKFVIMDPQGETVPGEVHYVDFARQRELATYRTDAYADILPPGNRPVSVVMGVFGYQQVEKFIDYTDPLTGEGVYKEGGAYVVPFNLVRLKKGDVSVMYNVAFYTDAVTMEAKSKKELDELVRMMNENPRYEITIHGHANGKDPRKIVDMGESKHYFNPAGEARVVATSKELSQKRAEAVRSYLVDNGIDKHRIKKIIAWGGSLMLVDEYSTGKRLNDRIEIEVVKD